MEKEQLTDEQRKEIEGEYQKRRQYNKMHGENPPIKGVRSKKELKNQIIIKNAERVVKEAE